MMTNIEKKWPVRLLAILLISGLTLSGNIGVVRPVTVQAVAKTTVEKKGYDQVLIPNEECWVYEENDEEDGTVTIKDFNREAFSGTLDTNKDYQLVIPAKIAGKEVRCVNMDKYWFWMYYKDSYVNFTSIKVSEGIKTIDSLLYYDDQSMDPNNPYGLSVEIPSSVEQIGDYAFYMAQDLTEVIIPQNSKLHYIDDDAFRGCTNLESIELPHPSLAENNDQAIIGESAFRGCESLKRVILYSNWIMNDAAFEECFALESFIVRDVGSTGGEYPQYLYEEDGILMNKYTEEVPIYGDTLDEYGEPEVESWEKVEKKELVCWPGAKKGKYNLDADTTFLRGAFVGAKGLTAITVDPKNENYTSVDGVLYSKDMKKLLVCPAGKTGTYTIPEGVCDIECVNYPYNPAFAYSSLTAIEFPDSMCEKYKSSEYGEITGSLGGQAWNTFSTCEKLEKIVLGKNITASEILRAFGETPNLKSITISRENPYICALDNIVYDKNVKTLLMIPLTKTGKLTLPDSVETNELTLYAFVDMKISRKEAGITEIELGENYKGGVKTWYENYEMDEHGNISNQSEAYETAEGAVRLSTLEKYSVSSKNTTLAASDGLLCSKNLKTVYHCPAAKKGVVTLPLGVEKVISTAFEEYIENFSNDDDVPTCVMQLNQDQNTVEKVSKIWKQVADYRDEDIVVKNAAGKTLTGTAPVGTGCIVSLMYGPDENRYSNLNIRCVLNDSTKNTTISSPKVIKSKDKKSKDKKPGKVTGLKVKNRKKKKIVVTWNRKANVSGYQIQYAWNRKFSKNKKSKFAGKKATAKTISKLKKGKKYYIRVRAYRKKSGKKLYGKWSKVKKVKIKK